MDEAAKLLAANKILIAAHYNPDADALGSSLGLAHALRAAGKDVYVYNESRAPERFAFLPGIAEVGSVLPTDNYEVVVVCDCGELKRLGDSVWQKFKEFPNILNIDHHISNDFFGRHNVVEENASSTSELIFLLLQAGKFSVPLESAICLYAGILGDTGSFRYACTTNRTFEVASQLVKLGASPSRIGGDLYSQKPWRQVLLESRAMGSIQFHADRRIAEVLVEPSLYAECGAGPDDTEGLVELARDIQGVLLSALIRFEGNLWKVSLRAKESRHDLSAVAARFGGGGHKAAAAFRWRKDLQGLRAELLAALKVEVDR